MLDDGADALRASLLVCADPGRIAHVRQILGPHASGLDHVAGLPQAIAAMRERDFDVLLIDLRQLGSDRMAWVEPIRNASMSVPVVLLSERDDPEEALGALRQGAQDHLHLQGESPSRIVQRIHHAVERQRLVVELEAARHRAQLAATHDPLTRLPNRYLLEEQTHRVLSHARRHDGGAALLYIDLDRFKSINDTLGHAAGDEVLVQVAGRLSTFTRESDVVARVGGDEFLILLTDIGGDRAPTVVAEKIQDAMAQPFRLFGRDYWVGASIGIAVFPRDGDDAERLMRHADLALYQVKSGGRGHSRFYSEALDAVAKKRHGMEHALRRALAEGGLRIVYQPIYTARDLRIVGAEALLRWHDPELGHVNPSEFISVAEESGLIVPLGAAVLRTACDQLAQWKHEGHALRMMVNLSAHQIDEDRLHELVTQAIWDSDLAPADLELEVTESALMRDEQVAVRTFRALKKIGVGISLDDFGTGFSSLSYLKRFPVDTVKIDRSFIHDLAFDGDDATIVSAILSIARQLDLNVVAEGVETEEQRAFLTERMCTHLQGYLLSPPLPPAAFGELLRSGAVPPKPDEDAQG
jgi:diguanylate cyclase (GGDEF)-like protein